MTVEELIAVLGVEVDQASFAKLSGALAEIQKGALGMVGALVGAFGAATAAVYATANATDKASDAAERLGITTQAWLEYGYVAKLSATDSATLESALSHLSLALQEAIDKGGDAATKFKGVGFKGADGEARELTETLEAIADRFVELPEGAARTAYAIDLFGKAGKQLVPLLNQGRDGIVQLREEAQRMGVVLDANAIAASKRYGDAVDRMSAALVGLRNRFSAPLIEKFTKLLENMMNVVSRNYRLFLLLASGVGLFVDALNWILEHENALRFVLIAVTTGFVAWGLSALAAAGPVSALWLLSVTAAAASAAAWIAAALPFIALGALIVLVAEDLYAFATGGESALGDLIAMFDEFNPDDSPIIELLKSAGSLLFDLTNPKKIIRFGDAIADALSPFGILKSVASWFQEQDDTRRVDDKFPGLANPLNREQGASFGDTLLDKFPGLPGGEARAQARESAAYWAQPGAEAVMWSPEQGASMSSTSTTTIAPQVIVQAQTNASPEQIGQIAAQKVNETLDTHFRSANAATGKFSSK